MKITCSILACVCSSAGIFMAAGALACTPPAEQAVYSIKHETYGDIGSHTLTFDCDGDDLVVETDVSVDVKLLFVTVYKRRARYREVWRGERLIAYDAWTDEAGEEYVTKARIENDAMIIDGVKPGITVPTDTVSSHPWNADVVDRTLLFGMKDGRLIEVDVEAAGEETIQIGEEAVTARKYVVRGDIDRELWYDRDGTWLRWRLENGGNVVDIVKQ